MFCARWCCRWYLLPTGFVGPTGVAAFFGGARWFCPLCFVVHWFCHSFCVARWFYHFLFVAPLVLPHVCVLARPLVLPPIFGNLEQRQDLIILHLTVYTSTLYPTLYPKPLSVTSPPEIILWLSSQLFLHILTFHSTAQVTEQHGWARGGELARRRAVALVAAPVVFLVFGAMWVPCWCLRAYRCTMLGLSRTIVGLSWTKLV